MTVELVVDRSVPPSGPLPSSNAVGISGQSSQSVRITRVRLTGGSSGIYLNLCTAPTLTFIEGHDARGPFPRGQCVQFDKCADAVLQDFSCVNNIGTPGVTNSSGSTSWTEDNISIFQSNNATIRRGMLECTHIRAKSWFWFWFWFWVWVCYILRTRYALVLTLVPQLNAPPLVSKA